MYTQAAPSIKNMAPAAGYYNIILYIYDNIYTRISHNILEYTQSAAVRRTSITVYVSIHYTSIYIYSWWRLS
jgi:hypothetical protein